MLANMATYQLAFISLLIFFPLNSTAKLGSIDAAHHPRLRWPKKVLLKRHVLRLGRTKLVPVSEVILQGRLSGAIQGS